MKNKTIQKFISRYNRYKKQRPRIWRNRLDKTLEHFWLLFYKMPVSEKTLLWAERNHARILKVKPPWY